jgi:hypothetical protein
MCVLYDRFKSFHQKKENNNNKQFHNERTCMPVPPQLEKSLKNAHFNK